MYAKFKKKNFQLVCRAFQEKSIDINIYNSLHFDQYSHLAIRFNIFLFSAINSKKNFKFVKSFS